ncbi:hypothetical protein K3495_g11229 [Podosphaera aphanis]|nr:hypothetical protein K3495_g11229 [Podosphaera aphanis]
MTKTQTTRIRFFKTRSQKRKRNNSDAAEERETKLIKAMLAMLADNYLESDMELPIRLTCERSTSITNPFVRTTSFEKFPAALFSQEKFSDIAFAAKEINGIRIPRTYNEVVNDKTYGPQWLQAIEEEINSLVANGTWEECLLPKDANLVSTKWVFTIKTHADGITERFKARLVARGFSQEYGVDYTETFAPTVRMDTLRLFLAIIARNDLECSHFDIKSAFTEAKLKEQIFLSPPEGVPVKSGRVLRAVRSLYGLKQAGRDWSLLLKDFLLNNKFKQSLADPCLYLNQSKRLWLLVYVDDIVAAAENSHEIDWFFKLLSFPLGSTPRIWGRLYLDTALETLGFPKGKYKEKKIPAADYENLRPTSEFDQGIDAAEYQHVVGKLMYAMILTIPDIAFVLGRLAQYMTNPSVHHGHALKSLMRYLRSTVKQKICYSPRGVHQDEFGIYTDADWASDKSDRKSISGGVGMFYGGPYSWTSKKQNSVATSSAESEYISQAMYAKQGQWTAQILRDLDIPHLIHKNGFTVQMFGDNQGALALVKNPQIHERSKHIDVCYHFIRDLAEKRRLHISYIPTNDMVADGLTRPLARVAYERFKGKLGLH